MHESRYCHLDRPRLKPLPRRYATAQAGGRRFDHRRAKTCCQGESEGVGPQAQPASDYKFDLRITS